MRLWSIHPKYLDAQGLIALWREALLAQRVLSGRTKGYKNHPQLHRFKKHPQPLSAIGFYLLGVYKEAITRGYNFTKEKILIAECKKIIKIPITSGQISYEFKHLMEKLRIRSHRFYHKVSETKDIKAHPLFKTVNGKVEFWERT
jgi:hypothetical protein